MVGGGDACEGILDACKEGVACQKGMLSFHDWCDLMLYYLYL